MAKKKELTILLRARNAMMAGIAGARNALFKFGGWVAGLGKRMAFAFLGAGAGMAGFVGLAARAYSKQERAEKALASALQSHGENVDALLPKLKAAASAIQDQTGAGDEQTLQTMANLRLLGVQSDRLEEAAKATLALKSANVNETAAAKMVALAYAGQYTMLSRYLPAIRTAKSEAEKAAAVNDFLASGYAQQRALLDTTGGAWEALKGRVGDALEEFGRAINKSEGISRMLQLAGNYVKRFGERVAEYIDSAKFDAMQQSVQGIMQALAEGGDARAEVLRGFGEAIRASFVLAAQEAVVVIKKGLSQPWGSFVQWSNKQVSGAKSGAMDWLTWHKPYQLMFGGEKSRGAGAGGTWELNPTADAKKRFDDAIARLAETGKVNYVPPPPKAAEGMKDVFTLAGAGMPEVVAKAVSEGMSGYLRSATDKLREMGNDVEEYGYRAAESSAQQQERIAAAAQEQLGLQEKTNSLLEETRDLLAENLEQG